MELIFGQEMFADYSLGSLKILKLLMIYSMRIKNRLSFLLISWLNRKRLNIKLQVNILLSCIYHFFMMIVLQKVKVHLTAALNIWAELLKLTEMQIQQTA